MNFEIVRSGSHTVYRNVLFRFYLKDNKYCLIYNGEKPPFEGFEKVTNEIYTILIPKRDLTNAFEIETRCIYKGFDFHVENKQGQLLRILIDNSEANRSLNLDIRDRGTYQTVVNINELDILWENRVTSHMDIPYPESMIHSKFIHLDKIANNLSDTSKL